MAELGKHQTEESEAPGSMPTKPSISASYFGELDKFQIRNYGKTQ